MKIIYIFSFLFIVSLTSCVRSFHTADYDRYADRHSTMAILPYDIHVVNRGKESISQEDYEIMINQESELFYNNLVDQILKKTGTDKGDVNISIQSTTATKKALKSAGIDAVNIADYSAGELKDILNVDVVLRPQLYTERFLSRTEAFLASTVLDVARETLDVVGLPGGRSVKASEIKIIASLEDTSSDAIVWRYDNAYEQDWTDEIDRDVASVNRNIAKYFPYRVK